ncbi:unnamed protein product [Trifolium pratense]|uniref:Uncharacterized protein n=1 Tax=Trifolium pratense TaxID=57577 RepID=A0ACB0LVR2_TRIPR|nr:unnamed protein product [Trifolium pratense]
MQVCVEEDSIGQAFREVQIQEGKYVTSRNLRDILYHELERNLAIKVEKMVKQPIHSLSVGAELGISLYSLKICKCVCV